MHKYPALVTSKCTLLEIKTFDENLQAEVQARIDENQLYLPEIYSLATKSQTEIATFGTIKNRIIDDVTPQILLFIDNLVAKVPFLSNHCILIRGSWYDLDLYETIMKFDN